MFSAIDEYKTDVYFGNGILTEEEDAEINAGILEDAIIEKMGSPYYNKNIGKVDYAYNRSDGNITDLLESLVQKADGNLLLELNKYTKVALTLAGLLTQEAHDADLDLQVTAYEESIKSGHKVLVVPRSHPSSVGMHMRILNHQNLSTFVNPLVLSNV